MEWIIKMVEQTRSYYERTIKKAILLDSFFIGKPNPSQTQVTSEASPVRLNSFLYSFLEKEFNREAEGQAHPVGP